MILIGLIVCGFSDDPDKQYEADVPANYDSLYIPPSKLDRDGDGNFRFYLLYRHRFWLIDWLMLVDFKMIVWRNISKQPPLIREIHLNIATDLGWIDR